MIDRSPRSSYESDWLPFTKVTARRAVGMAIGQALRARSEILQHLPHDMLALLMQLNAPHEDPQQARLSGPPHSSGASCHTTFLNASQRALRSSSTFTAPLAAF